MFPGWSLWIGRPFLGGFSSQTDRKRQGRRIRGRRGSGCGRGRSIRDPTIRVAS